MQCRANVSAGEMSDNLGVGRRPTKGAAPVCISRSSCEVLMVHSIPGERHRRHKVKHCEYKGTSLRALDLSQQSPVQREVQRTSLEARQRRGDLDTIGQQFTKFWEEDEEDQSQGSCSCKGKKLPPLDSHCFACPELSLRFECILLCVAHAVMK